MKASQARTAARVAAEEMSTQAMRGIATRHLSRRARIPKMILEIPKVVGLRFRFYL